MHARWRARIRKGCNRTRRWHSSPCSGARIGGRVSRHCSTQEMKRTSDPFKTLVQGGEPGSIVERVSRTWNESLAIRFVGTPYSTYCMQTFVSESVRTQFTHSTEYRRLQRHNCELRTACIVKTLYTFSQNVSFPLLEKELGSQ